MDDPGVDRLSGLGDHLLSSILDILPVDDAVRTGFLSNCWRYRWRKLTKLVFDRQFYEKLGQSQHSRLITIINKLLLLNVGSISKFHIYIPNKFEDHNIFDGIDQWILYLSSKPVKELIIENNTNHYYQPLSCLYTTFDKLIFLKLDRCIFKPPLALEDIKFLHLQKLILFNVNFTQTNYPKEISLPALDMLLLRDRTNVHNFNIKASNLKTLRLERFSCSDLRQLKCAFCMFCNSPNLEALLMTDIQMDLDYMSPAVYYLKREARFNLTQLQTFEISTLQGSPQQMAFLELLLGRSPSLKKCLISTVFGWKHIIRHDVLKFNWASKTSQLIIKELVINGWT